MDHIFLLLPMSSNIHGLLNIWNITVLRVWILFSSFKQLIFCSFQQLICWEISLIQLRLAFRLQLGGIGAKARADLLPICCPSELSAECLGCHQQEHKFLSTIQPSESSSSLYRFLWIALFWPICGMSLCASTDQYFVKDPRGSVCRFQELLPCVAPFSLVFRLNFQAPQQTLIFSVSSAQQNQLQSLAPQGSGIPF